MLAGFPFISRAEEGYLKAGDAGYEESRRIFNSDLSASPRYVARCRSEEEVVKAVGFARGEGLPVAIKSGGHCFIGSCLNDGGLVIDLAGLSQKVYLPETNRLVAGPGVKLGALYDLLLPQGRLLPAGSCAGVGLGGLALGGGYGLFAREYGLTCDHLTRVKMVDGSGAVIDSDEDGDLLWACRGGGNGNFGVVTSMEFETREARATFGAQRFVATGLSAAKAVGLMEGWFEVAKGLAEPIFSAFVFNGRQITVLLTTSYRTTGPSFQEAVGALKKVGFTAKGATNSPTGRALKRYYGRPGPLPFYNVSGGYYRGFGEVAHCAAMVAEKVISTPGLIFQINTLGGAIARGPESAYAHREFPFLGEIQGYWEEERRRDGLVAAVTEVREAIGAEAQYRNYPDITLENPQEAYYGEAYGRLQTLKARYDAENVIRHAQSVSL